MIKWTLLFKKLLVVREVDAGKDPLEEVAPLILLNRVLKTLFLFF